VDVLPYGAGTTAQRDAQTTVPTGAVWFNTNTRSVDRWDGAAWQRDVAYFGVGDAATRAALAGAQLYDGLLWLETDTNLIYRYTGAAWVLFAVASGTQAARPAAAAANLGLLYGNTDDKVVQRSTGAAWVDLWPPLDITSALSTFAQAFVKEVADDVQVSSGVDLSLAVVTPARGTWKIIVFGIVTVRSASDGQKLENLSQIVEDGGVVGSPSYSSKNDNSDGGVHLTSHPLHTRTGAAGVTYTYKLRTTVDINAATLVQAGIYAMLVKTA
jgi:hypothetical protein